MSGVRRTRLLRVADLAGLRQALIDLAFRDRRPHEAASSTTAGAASTDAFVLVPTRAAGRELARTLDQAPPSLVEATPSLVEATPSWGRLLTIGTRADLYTTLASRVPELPRLIGRHEREVIAGAIAREVDAAGTHPPFRVRPVLIAEMLALYDQIRRQGRTVADFERNVGGELEMSADSDRGAAQLLDQTRFLADVYRRYEDRLTALGAHDEHRLRDALIERAAPVPLRHVTVTVADRTADPDGLWPVDFMLLSRLPGLERLDVIATESILSAGWLERLDAALPGIEAVRAGAAARHTAPHSLPTLVVPSSASISAAGRLVHYSRDREEELAQAARRIKAERRAGRLVDPDRIALVVRRPLPYLYLAGDVLGGAGIPFEALDTLPLAAEPYAAAVDLVLDAVSSGFSRVALTALLGSPHFAFGVDRAGVSALGRALAEARYNGGLDRLETFAAQWIAIAAPANRDERRQAGAAGAAQAAVRIARELAPLAQARPLAEQIELLQTFLALHDAAGIETPGSRLPAPGSRDDAGERTDRRSRVQSAVTQTLAEIANAYRHRDADVRVTVEELTATIRRWLGEATVATTAGASGVRIIDAQAARFGDFDDVQLVGLVEGEWPERPRRSIFYPASLLALLEPGPATAIDMVRRERDGLRAARASFRDLLGLARVRVRVSTFALEADAVVEPSTFVDDLAALALPEETEVETFSARIFRHEALALTPPAVDALPPLAAAWARVRLDRARGPDSRFLGETGPWILPRVSVSRVDRYLDCPFRFYASEVLKLEEEPEDEDLRTPLERGRFLHEIFETFFREWQAAGRGRIRPADVPAARQQLIDVCERALAGLPPTEAALERARLLGSAAGAGIIDRVLSLEASRDDEVRERLIEFPVEGPLRFRSASGGERVIALNAKVDRVDVLGDGGFRLIDYKSKFTPDVKRKVQLPIYATGVRQRLSAARGRDVPAREALYLSFEGDRAVVPLKVKGVTLDEVIAGAEDRFLEALDAIAAGHFPPRPVPRSLCNTCPYDTVCRKAFVDDPPDDGRTSDADSGRGDDE